MAIDVIYLNGEFMPLEAARIPVLDRGFIFGDGVYEVIPVYSRHPFRLPEHLRRLQHSLEGIRLANPLTDPEWTRLLTTSSRAIRAMISRFISRSRAALPGAPTNFRRR